MAYYQTKDNVSLYYKDWGKGQPILFSHGWPLSGDAWEDQMLFMADKGYRAIAHDRRGHGRSEQPWNGNDMDTYADDLAQLIEKLDLTNVVLVGHSTGGGEVTRYIGKYGSKRVAGLVLVGAVTPGMLQTTNNPDGVPMSVFDGIRENVRKDRAQFFKDFTAGFYGANRPNSKVSQGARDAFWQIAMQTGLKATLDCIAAFSESEFTEDFKKVDIPTLIIHGDDDQIVPIDITARKVEKLVKGSELKLYPGGDHGLPTTHKEQISQDILSFVESKVKSKAMQPA